MNKYLKTRLALIVCLCLCLSFLAANSANAEVTVSDPVIDDTTHGDWRGIYGECFFLIPDPEQSHVEVAVGPDFFSMAPDQYNTSNCFGGLLFTDSLIDFRIYRGLVPSSTNAFTWSVDGEPIDVNMVARQWNPCRNRFKAATWDDGDPANPVIQPRLQKL